jgi:hypothetical protein
MREVRHQMGSRRLRLPERELREVSARKVKPRALLAP